MRSLWLALSVAALSLARAAAPEVEGTWEAKALVTKGTPFPGSAGQVLEFGEAYATETYFTFWARTGPRANKDWTLFSWKDGKLTPIVQHYAAFVGPDSEKAKVFRTALSANIGATPIHAGSHLLYLSASPTFLCVPHRVYAWDGEKLVKVLSRGDVLQVGERRFEIHEAFVLAVGAGGKALVFWESPWQRARGWALHDGARFTALWKEGDKPTGLRGVGIGNLRVQDYPDSLYIGAGPVGLPRLLEDGSLIAILPVAEAWTGRRALLRVWPDRAEEIAPRNPPDLVLAAAPQAVLASDQWTERVRYGEYKGYPRLLSIAAGKVQAHDALPLRELLADGAELKPGAIIGGWAGITAAAFLGPDSLRALVTMRVSGRHGQGSSYPAIYFWDGEKLSSVVWEDALGLPPDAVRGLLRAHRKGPTEAKIRAIPGPAGGVIVTLPPLGGAPATWYVPSNSADGKLQPVPRFPVEGRVITLADVISWKEPNEVLTQTEEGYFLLRRTR